MPEAYENMYPYQSGVSKLDNVFLRLKRAFLEISNANNDSKIQNLKMLFEVLI